MAFIEPLALETWVISVFSGSPEIFSAVALMVIAGLAAFFRMNGIAMFFMLGIFFLMFSEFIGASLIALISIISGLLIVLVLSKVFCR